MWHKQKRAVLIEKIIIFAPFYTSQSLCPTSCPTYFGLQVGQLNLPPHTKQITFKLKSFIKIKTAERTFNPFDGFLFSIHFTIQICIITAPNPLTISQCVLSCRFADKHLLSIRVIYF